MNQKENNEEERERAKDFVIRLLGLDSRQSESSESVSVDPAIRQLDDERTVWPEQFIRKVTR